MAISANQFWAGDLLDSRNAPEAIPLTSDLTLLLLGCSQGRRSILGHNGTAHEGNPWWKHHPVSFYLTVEYQTRMSDFFDVFQWCWRAIWERVWSIPTKYACFCQERYWWIRFYPWATRRLGELQCFRWRTKMAFQDWGYAFQASVVLKVGPGFASGIPPFISSVPGALYVWPCTTLGQAPYFFNVIVSPGSYLPDWVSE